MTRIVLTAALLFSAAVFAISCSDPAKNLPVYGHVPEFRLTDSYGQPFDSKSLNGKVWVVDFIYTHCPGPCPRMTSQMHSVERELNGAADVRLVSFSVDPARDTPPVLNAYAQQFGGASEQWHFLTGTPQTLHHLARNVFMVGDLVGIMDHSTKFIVVDKKSQIRGFYSTFDPDGMKTLLHDVNALRRSRS